MQMHNGIVMVEFAFSALFGLKIWPCDSTTDLHSVWCLEWEGLLKGVELELES